MNIEEKNPENPLQTKEVSKKQTEKKPEQTEKKPEQTEKKPEQTEKKPEQTEKKPEQTEKKPEQTEKKPEQTEKKPEQTEKKPLESFGNPKETKPLTIKSFEEDRTFFAETASLLGITQAQMFSLLISNYKNVDDTKMLAEQLEFDKKKLQQTIEHLESQLDEERLKEKTVEKIVEVEKKLTGPQFICELPEQVALAARKCRPFMLKDGVIADSSPNAIVEAALRYFLKHKYDHILDPAFRNKF